MTTKPDPGAPPEPLSLQRWSRRKLDAARVRQEEPSAAPTPPPSASPTAAVGGEAQSAAAQLPPLESLTPDSDFSAFFQRQGKVDESLKRAALKKLFRDPQFNVMDGLDIYVGDYTQSDPIPDEVLQRLVQARAIFNPPKTTRTPEGHVVDVPPAREALAAEDAAEAAGGVRAEPAPPGAIDQTVAVDPPVAADDPKAGATS